MSSEEELVKNLAAMLHTATDSSTDAPDELAIDMFCSIIQNHPHLIKRSTDMLLEKIKSNNINQSRKALDVLDECMAKSGTTFQMEVAKFRFLNELIRLVSKKYLADKTPVEIRDKIMDCLLLWTIQYPDKNKIKEAYDILRKEGVEHAVTPSVCPNEKRKVFFEPNDEELLRKLLHSKNPDDILKANLLIKRLYRQDAKKNDLTGRQRTELLEAKNTIVVLDQMINSWTKESHENNDQETVSLMQELYENCKKFSRTVLRISETVEDDEDLLKDAIEVSESLTEIMEKYIKAMSKKRCVQPKSESNVPAPNESLDLLCGMVDDAQATSCSSSHTLEEELKNVFKPVIASTSPFESNTDFLPNIGLLEPTPFGKDEIKINVVEKDIEEYKSLAATKENAFSDIDRISNELLQQNLNSTKREAKFKDTPKIPLNQLIKENQTKSFDSTIKSCESNLVANGLTTEFNTAKYDQFMKSSATEQNTYSIDQILNKVQSISNMKKDLKNSTNTNENAVAILDNSAHLSLLENRLMTHKDDLCDLLLKTDDKLLETNTLRNSTNDEEVKAVAPKSDIPLSEISLDINSIKPSRITPQIIMDDTDGLRIILNYALDRPSVNIIVIVITTTNQSLSSIDNYEIEASVRKPCKLRLLPLIEKCLPGVEPFQPPAQNIKQILLLYNPTKQPVDITFIIGYKLGDDPDPIKESVIGKNIPYFE